MDVKILMPKVNPKSFIDDYLQKIGIEYPQSYMDATRRNLEEPNRYLNIDEATHRLKQAIDNHERVGIIQDCDVDGVCSAVIAYQFLDSLMAEKPIVFFHTGKQHGIGDLMPQILNANLDLLIVPDAGTNDVDACRELRDNGVNIIIADHHEIEKENPFAIVVNCMHGDTNHAASGTTVMSKIIDRYGERYLGGRRFDFDDMVALSLLSDSRSMLSVENRAYFNLGFGGCGKNEI